MTFRSTLIGLLTVAIVLAAELAQAQYAIDLTTIPRAPASTDAVEVNWLSLAEGRPSIPIEVTLLDLDKRTYALGQSAIFTVRLKNLGDLPIAVPWEAWGGDHARLAQAATGDQPLLESHIELVSVGSTGNVETLSLVTMEGTRAIEDSVRVLAPGETAEIRASGELHLDLPDARQSVFGTNTSATVDVHGGFEITVAPRVLSTLIQSGNSFQVLLNTSSP